MLLDAYQRLIRRSTVIQSVHIGHLPKKLFFCVVVLKTRIFQQNFFIFEAGNQTADKFINTVI